MTKLFNLGFALLLASAAAHAGDEVIGGRVPEKSGDEFCATDPTNGKEVCVPQDKKEELEKKLKKKEKQAIKLPRQPEATE